MKRRHSRIGLVVFDNKKLTLRTCHVRVPPLHSGDQLLENQHAS